MAAMTDGEDYNEEEEEEEEEEYDEELEGLKEEEAAEVQLPTTKPWLTPAALTETQKMALRWYANHPADPIGELDSALKAAVLEDGDEKTPKSRLLRAPQRSLPDKKTRDFVLGFKRDYQLSKPVKLAVVGLPGTGKSSMINALLNDERSVVNEKDGTTMDAIVSDWKFKDQDFKLIDTCGVIKGWRFPDSMMKQSAFLGPGVGTRKAIRRANLVVLCLDAQKSRKMKMFSCPSDFEVSLGKYIADEGKCLVIAVNKWDLIPEDQQPKVREAILTRISDKFNDMKGLPVIFVSAKYNLNLSTMMTRCLALYKRWSARLPTSKINTWLKAFMLRWPPPWKGGAKRYVKYMVQTGVRPPTFVMWTNTTDGDFPPNYLRQIQNAMREEFRIGGVPMRLIMRTTLMPKPKKKLTRFDVLKWRRMGEKQAIAVENLTAKRMIRLRYRRVDAETE